MQVPALHQASRDQDVGASRFLLQMEMRRGRAEAILRNEVEPRRFKPPAKQVCFAGWIMRCSAEKMQGVIELWGWGTQASRSPSDKLVHLLWELDRARDRRSRLFIGEVWQMIFRNFLEDRYQMIVFVFWYCKILLLVGGMAIKPSAWIQTSCDSLMWEPLSKEWELLSFRAIWTHRSVVSNALSSKLLSSCHQRCHSLTCVLSKLSVDYRISDWGRSTRQVGKSILESFNYQLMASNLT